MDLDEAPHGDALKVLLRLLEDEVCARHGPSLGDTGQGNGTSRGEAHVVCGADGKVGEEEQVADAIGAQLEIADGDAVFRGAPQGPEMNSTDINWSTEGIECFLGFGVKRLGVSGESDSSFSTEC